MQGRIYFDPTARFVGSAAGRIEIIATPSFWQLVLVKSGGAWRFKTDELKEMNKGWSHGDFTEIVTNLLKKK
jgi:hypothetical protein